MHLLVVITAWLWVSRCSGDCDVQVRGVADALKPVIVNKHNELRAKVANGKEGSLPKASNMLEMIWDDTVAGKAQEWANKCKFAHDQPADRDTGNGYTGQNIAYESNQDENPDWEAIVQRFYNEVTEFDSNAIDKYYFQRTVGHFTQVIWANTYKVGCGYIRYLLDNGNYYHLYGCDYLPGGNILNEPIYERGEPCSACGGCGSVFGLCGYEEVNSSNEFEENINTGDYGKNIGVKQKSSIINLDGRSQCNVQVRGVNGASKMVIVRKHNELRAKVANGKQGHLPKAANMLKMVWDDSVAKKAQEWANKCKFQHDTPADRDTGNGYTGQNIAYASNQNPNPDWEGIIQDFYNEVAKFDSRSIDRYNFQSDTGHFTQIIWAKTYKVGCGYVRHQEGRNYVHLYGCNYLPGGNIINEPIYEKGAPCSKCGGCGSTPGLCRSRPGIREDEANFNYEYENIEKTFGDALDDIFDDLFL